MEKHLFFDVIINAEKQRITLADWPNYQLFIKSNEINHLFGTKARESGIESPIKASYIFIDGNKQSLRGDWFTGNPITMVKNLQKKSLEYIKQQKILEVKIFDNRDQLHTHNKTILYWTKEKGTIINLLPVYSGEFDLIKKNAKG